MIITVSAQYGSGALPVTQGVAERLGYHFINDELPTVVATRLGISREAAERVGAAPKSLGERLLRGLMNATPETANLTEHGPDIDAEFVRAIEHAVREAADHGNCVIFGRSAGRILADRADVLSIFLHAPVAWRTKHVMELLSCDEKTARAEIVRVDDARVGYSREYYKVDRNDARLYHLSLDIARFGLEGAIAAIVAAHASASSAA